MKRMIAFILTCMVLVSCGDISYKKSNIENDIMTVTTALNKSNEFLDTTSVNRLLKLGKNEIESAYVNPISKDNVFYESVYMRYKNFIVLYDYFNIYSKNIAIVGIGLMEGNDFFGCKIGSAKRDNVLKELSKFKLEWTNGQSIATDGLAAPYYYGSFKYTGDFTVDLLSFSMDSSYISAVFKENVLIYVEFSRKRIKNYKPFDGISLKGNEYIAELKQGKISSLNISLNDTKEDLIKNVSKTNKLIKDESNDDYNLIFENGIKICRGSYIEIGKGTVVYGINPSESNNEDVISTFGKPNSYSFYDPASDEWPQLTTDKIEYKYTAGDYSMRVRFNNNIVQSIIVFNSKGQS